MAFENNQQDAFNLRNDTESLKQWQLELDKATTSIGAAEVAAEEELAVLKLKNLNAQQEMHLKQLNQLIEKEEAGIRKLAALRLELSDKQFEVRKKEIQKELQLIKEAMDELSDAEDKKAKKSNSSAATQTSDTENTTATSKAKPIYASEKASVKESKKSTDPELVKLVGSIDKTLGSLHDTVVKYNQPKEKEFVPDIKSSTQQTSTVVPKNVPAAPKSSLVEEDVGAKVSEPQQQNIEIDKQAFVKDTENTVQPELINLVSSIDKTLGSLFATVAKQSKESSAEANTKATQTSTAKDLQESVRTKTGTASNDETPETASSDYGGGTTKTGVGQSEPPKESRNYTDDSSKMKTVDLGTTSVQDIINGFDEIRNALKVPEVDKGAKQISENPTLALLDSIIKKAEKDKKDTEEAVKKGIDIPEPQLSQTTLDLGGELLKSIEEARKAEEEFQEFKKAQELNTQLLRQKREQDRLKELSAAEYEQIKKQAELEGDIAFNAAHAEELTAQALRDKQNSYAEEYAKYQLEAGKYAVSLEEFKKDKAKKDNKVAKKEAVGGIVDGLKKFGTGEFSMTDIKKSAGEYMGQRTAELQADGMSEAGAKTTAALEMVAEAAGTLADTLDAKVKEISVMQGIVDTRLQGSQANEQKGQSYWKQLLKDAKSIAGASPFIKQEKLVDNIKALIEKGISFDIKQRAFLMTIQEKVANTFDVADGTLLRLIRIQQQDTTAGRLGMESALNSFLNSMYETSEYLSEVAAGVRSSLEEMQALMDGAAATEVEFQVQKWMGSLYSVGMSKSAVDSIAQTFGQIASGDVSGLTGNGTGNLLIMAANEAGMSIADILQDGLNADETNKLMQAMVNYLAEIAETSGDSRVVQQQLASVYGVKASDMKAATNLASSIKDVSKQDLTYNGMLGQLKSMMNSIRFRTSISEGMTNMWDNTLYSMASTQASNPILYALPKMADLLRDVTGGDGIALPFLNVYGFGVDLNTSVADLMSVASMAGTALGALGPLLTGIADLVNPMAGSSMLQRAGISTSGKAPVIARGSAQPLQHLGGSSISESGYVGNSSGDDVKNATMQGAEDDKKKQMVEAKEEETADDVATNANLAVVNIYNLLEEVAHGSQSLRVRLVTGPNSIGGGGQNNIIGENSGTNTTGAGVNNGTDNGNWVLTF